MALWTPADITTALWLDAADSSTLFDATSGGSLVAADGAVARWEDKSGNGRHVRQATIGNRPQRKIAIQNGLDVVRFDGSNDLLSSVSTSIGYSGASVFLVWRRRSGANNAGGLFLHNDNTFPNRLFNIYSADGASIRFEAGGANTAPSTTISGLSSGAAYLTSGTFNTSGTGNHWINGSGLQTHIASYFVSVAASVVTVGSYAGFWDGDIIETVILATAATTIDRQLIEGYLAHKWGLAANLPSDHPYKNAAPTTGAIQSRRRRDLGGYGLWVMY
jgi:hypothetical protein